MSQYCISAGSWDFRGGDRGLTLLDCADGHAVPVRSFLSELNVGTQCVDTFRKIIYLPEEMTGGDKRTGSYIAAVKYDLERGELSLLSRKRTYGCNASFCTLDKSGRYLLVTHHDEGPPDGDKDPNTATVVLFRVEEDGTIGEIADYYAVHGDRPPHLHSVYAAPAEDLCIVSDKGLDRVYTFAVDRENGKLIFLHEGIAEADTNPRYGVFHPSLPLFYGNNEKKPVLYIWTYTADGSLSRSEAIPAVEGRDGEKIQASDIRIHPSGKKLYLSLRGADLIVTFDILEDGTLAKCGERACGKGPRGTLIDPEGTLFFSANRDDNKVEVIRIEEDGSLGETISEADVPVPGNLAVLL